MGTRGPIPKRTDEKVRHVKEADKPSSAPAGDPVEWTESLPHWHPIAADWYESLARSGQAVYYQQSDVQFAVYVAEAMSRPLAGKSMSGQLFSSITGALSSLLVTEADRRRVQIELEKATDAEAEAEVIALELYSSYD